MKYIYRKWAEHVFTSNFPFDVRQICWTGIANCDAGGRHTRTAVDIQKVAW